MKKGKLTPAERFEQRRRRAARRARGRERRRRNAEARVIAWLADAPPFTTRLGWDMQLYSIDIPVVPEIAAAAARTGKPLKNGTIRQC